ncbi:uncharacterized protein LOC135683408 [Rhopilema esculentum]|uniref:uncharacterized protein LOC135683408 n=1 Tax=Rhopilema esculentum TaxID=499914 RepID=UPI0031D01480
MFLKVLLAIGCCSALALGSSHWSYSGINGPSHWAEEYPNCGKSRQSPINIVTRRTLYRRRRLENNYDEMPSDLRFSLANNGHSAQVTLSNTGNLHLHVFGQTFKPLQVHFHWGSNNRRGSEHTRDRRRYPGEVRQRQAASVDYVFPLACLVLSCLVLSCLVLSCLVLSCLVLSCLVLSCLVLSCYVFLFLSCLVFSCLFLSFLVFSCLFLSCLVLSLGFFLVFSCLFLSCLFVLPFGLFLSSFSCLVLSCLVLSCLVLSCLVLSCYVLSCLVLSCLVLSCLVLSRVFWGRMRQSKLFGYALLLYKNTSFDQQGTPILSIGNGHGFRRNATSILLRTGGSIPSVLPAVAPRSGLTPMFNLDNIICIGQTFKPLQVHFHWGSNNRRGSEHTRDRRRYPGEMHFVHMNAKYGTAKEAKKHRDGLLVLGSFISIDDFENEDLLPIFNSLDQIKKQGQKTEIYKLDLNCLMPSDTSKFFFYDGSLTTPGCNQAVKWIVFRNTVPLCQSQINSLRVLKYKGSHGASKRIVNNYRPIQRLNGRRVYRTFHLSCY